MKLKIKAMMGLLTAVLAVMPILMPMSTVHAEPKAEQQTQQITKKDKQRAELRTKTYKALLDLYQKKPKSRAAIQNSYGYAVFVDTSYTMGILGGGHGRGRAINLHSKREVFMKMGEVKLGLGLGIRQSNIIFVFGNKDAFDDFVNKGWKFGGQAVAAAGDGVNGDALEGSFQVAPSMWMYQVTTKGLTAELSLKGTNFYVDKDLNVDTVVQ